MIVHVHVRTAIEYKAAAVLFREYAEWLNIDLSFQHFEEELKELAVMYGPPSGGVILAKKDDEYVGCIAIRKINDMIAELKRMYIIPSMQKQGLGQSLLNEALGLARELNYEKIRLDTLSSMTPAMNLYKRNGFYEIPAYYHNPEPNAVYFERLLLAI